MSHKLTRREQQILQHILKEESCSEIALALHISVRTVETHRKNIMKKTGCHNIVALVKLALSSNEYIIQYDDTSP